MAQTVFVLEDETDIAALVQLNLQRAGYVVQSFSHSADILPAAQKESPALFLLDIMVPGGGGLEVCRRIRQTAGLASVPVIFLTALASEADRVHGLELGADDYIVKPFSPRELVARVRAVLRRFERPESPDVLRFGDVELDAGGMEMRLRGQVVPMTATEFRLLDYLARHPGRVFSRDQLLDAVWGDARFVTPRSVDVYVRRIREKMEEDADNPRFLKTMRGAGYRFERGDAERAR